MTASTFEIGLNSFGEVATDGGRVPRRASARKRASNSPRSKGLSR